MQDTRYHVPRLVGLDVGPQKRCGRPAPLLDCGLESDTRSDLCRTCHASRVSAETASTGSDSETPSERDPVFCVKSRKATDERERERLSRPQSPERWSELRLSTLTGHAHCLSVCVGAPMSGESVTVSEPDTLLSFMDYARTSWAHPHPRHSRTHRQRTMYIYAPHCTARPKPLSPCQLPCDPHPPLTFRAL